ncbi:MAG TPA: GatB/YqeY domain-containing protein [Bacteroidales bacterium]|mgnify:CR=1 FL=1|nr:GatB/YqeY domain-containing protein [Bacteroidales bacterium]HOK98219.1 GatB/YqeY domain-containing protein [Bacteroidales bacterium]HPO64990.1 GatB/YqeY domain-containing protein [Bacteroidales bacterium]
MGLFETINDDIKAAMLAKEKEKLEALRAIKAALLLAKTEKGASQELSAETEIKVLQRMVKQRKESAEIYQSQNRPDLAEKELFEASVIEKYLPAQMSAEELEKVVRDIVARVGAKSPADMGKVMGVATKELAGKAEGKMIAETVKKVLASL